MTEFKVGDRVRWIGGRSESTVLGVRGSDVWIEWEDFGTSVVAAKYLILIPDTVTIEVSRKDAEMLATWRICHEDPFSSRMALAARKALEANRD